MPLDWAMTQNNLGSALASLGERESGTARLEEAVAAYRAALTERTRERVPLLWAGTQQNLAIVFRVLATRSIGDARVAYLRDALAAVDGALEVYRAGNAAFYVERAERLRGRHSGRNATDAGDASLIPHLLSQSRRKPGATGRKAGGCKVGPGFRRDCDPGGSRS